MLQMGGDLRELYMKPQSVRYEPITMLVQQQVAAPHARAHFPTALVASALERHRLWHMTSQITATRLFIVTHEHWGVLNHRQLDCLFN